MPGDVNHDNNVNVSDVTLLIAYLLGSPVDVCTTCADVNGDDGITVSDVTRVISAILSQ